MAHIECCFYSAALKKNARCTVFIPTTSPDDHLNSYSRNYYDNKTVYQTLYLLHGSYGFGDDYFLFSNIERYAQDKCLAVVMPSVENSAYMNIDGSSAYATWCAEELPTFLQTIFPLSSKREDTFVAGLSMGGYGATYLSLKNPSRYSACAVMSGCDDFYDVLNGTSNYAKHFPENYKRMLFGCDDNKHSFNLNYFFKQYKGDVKNLPKFYFTSGKDDLFIKEIFEFADVLSAGGCSVEKVAEPGVHDWNYWDAHVQDVINWFPLAGKCVPR